MVKDFIRNILLFLRLDLTKNLKYDRLTKNVIKKAVINHSVCIDVGCHKGEIFDLFIKNSPQVSHYGFEPIPSLFKTLKQEYSKHHIFDCALSDEEGVTEFQFVKNAPAYSGIKNRAYAIENPEIEKIKVPLKTLDSIIKENPVHFIKIDVEGGELGVLKGAKETILRNKPIIIFECGLGASDYYHVKPQDIYELIVTNYGLKLSLLDRWLRDLPSLTKNEFIDIYEFNKEYYFIAYP